MPSRTSHRSLSQLTAYAQHDHRLNILHHLNHGLVCLSGRCEQRQMILSVVLDNLCKASLHPTTGLAQASDDPQSFQPTNCTSQYQTSSFLLFDCKMASIALSGRWQLAKLPRQGFYPLEASFAPKSTFHCTSKHTKVVPHS